MYITSISLSLLTGNLMRKGKGYHLRLVNMPIIIYYSTINNSVTAEIIGTEVN
jgi:hypothetical protein